MKQIAILGSTGSIGCTLINIIKKDKSNFNIKLLSCNSNYRLLINQAMSLNVKNLIITDKKYFFKVSKNKKYNNFNVFNTFEDFHKVFKKKIDYCMSAISGISGLMPTCLIIKYCKNIAIANKEAIICGWPIIKKNLKKYSTNFIPVDSEHFSIWYGINSLDNFNIERIYLTASGGPFVNLKLNKFNLISIKETLKHPNWNMGKKISVDSATMMNKVFEIIEAKNIFNLDYNKLSIFVHPKSYVHAIVKFTNGMSKMIIHDTTMKIPIFNSLYLNEKKKIKSSEININILNNLNLSKVNKKRFPLTKIINFLPKNNSLFETVIVSANDELVQLFLEKKISFLQIQKFLLEIVKSKLFLSYKQSKPTSIKRILSVNKFVRLKVREMCI